jgi:D-alanyl-D-alanine carboxypeptidase (penicillin-binding protein 5/6)
VLWRRRPRERMPVASLTKIMTALVVVEETTSRERARVTRAALAYSGSGVGVLPRGRRVPVEGLLHGLLLVSGNDAAIALADHVAGSERRFVRLMNRRAGALGLRCTRFRSSHGLERGNRSCAADLAALTRLAMAERRIARIVRKPTAAVRFPIRTGRLFLNSTNPLVRGGYPGALGLKTGYTEDAGRCLVGVARRGPQRLGVVLLHSSDPARQARKLLTTGFRRG